MKTINLTHFFELVNYNWEKDKSSISEICKYTKTRPNPEKIEFELTWGMEQTFLVKAIAEWFKADSFFEIGTGRGTACYAISLIPSVKRITTIDIIPFDKKQNTAVNFQPIKASNEDLYQMIPYGEKEKIQFLHRKEIQKAYDQKYDLCFIDGNHNKAEIIEDDIKICLALLKENGIIIFDDYDPKFTVQKVVDRFLKANSQFNSFLIEFRGHLFTGELEKNKGIVIVGKDLNLV